MNQHYKAYIKDCLHLNELPKNFLTVLSGNPADDILTSKSSSFDCLEEIPEDVHEGDIFCLYAPNGKVVYQGVIKAKEDKQIQTDHIYALFDQDWFYHIQKKAYLEEEIAAVFNDFKTGALGKIVTSLPEANETNYELNQNYFVYHTDTGGNYYSEHRVNMYEEKVSEESEETQLVYKMDEIGSIMATEISQITDPMIVQKYGAFSVTYENNQAVHLTTPDDLGDMRNIQQFIYSLYDSYGIVVEVTIPYHSGCNIHIKTASYDSTKISSNTSNILEIAPKTETEETNKLVIFGSAGNFRKTYYATKNGIVTDGSDTNRLPVINTAYIYSDDSLEDIKTENLKEEMYNHEIIFNMIMNNNIYDFYDWKFGQPLEVYYKNDVYDSIYTGYEYSFSEGETPAYVEITCGIVRTKLTDKLNMEKKTTGSSSHSVRTSGGGSSSGDGVSKDYVDTALANKVDKVSGKGLSTNDYTTAEKNKLANLATVATSGSYSDLTNKPTIPTVNNATLTIQKNGTNVTAFTANASSNATANITVPTKVSELTNDSGYTTNTGTITGITMNGSSKGTSGVVNLGTVLTAHQDISGKQDKITPITAQTTQAIYPVTIDTQGHITSVGSAAVIPEGVVVDLAPSTTSNNAIANSAVSNNFVFNTGTQGYDISGTTFTVGSVTFKIEVV